MLIGKSCQPLYVTCSGFKHDKTLLISILYIKILIRQYLLYRVLINILYIKNTNKAVYLLNL
jgi:hypothetical protein